MINDDELIDDDKFHRFWSIWFDCNGFLFVGGNATKIQLSDNEIDIVWSRIDQIGNVQRH